MICLVFPAIISWFLKFHHQPKQIQSNIFTNSVEDSLMPETTLGVQWPPRAPRGRITVQPPFLCPDPPESFPQKHPEKRPSGAPQQEEELLSPAHVLTTV